MSHETRDAGASACAEADCEALLRIEGLTKVFRRRSGSHKVAVDHVSFELAQGETLGIVGQSGSGKSTIARMVMGLAAPTEGHVWLRERDLTRLRGRAQRETWREMQMVFQQPAASFDPRRTLGYGITESLRNQGYGVRDRQARAETLLNQVGLDPSFARRYPSEVSGGQCQRCSLARALACEPSLLVCDEMTSALDVTVQRQIMDLMEHLRDRHGLSCLFISHNLALVQQFCDRVLVLKDGLVQEQGPCDQVINHPSSPYTRELIEAVL